MASKPVQEQPARSVNVHTTTDAATAHLLRYLADCLSNGTIRMRECRDTARGPGERVLILDYVVPKELPI